MLFRSLIILNFILVECLIHPNLVKEFFAKNNLYYNIVLTCYSKRDNVQLTKELTIKKNVLLIVNNMKNVDSLKPNVFEITRLGIIMDLQCNKSIEILLEGRNWPHFDATKFWLIFYDSTDYLRYFTNVDLGINSEVKLAYSKHNSGLFTNQSDELIVQALYNPAYEKGGALKIITVGYYDVRDGYVVTESRNKYMDRRNLTGVNLKGLIVLTEPFKESLDDYLKSDENIEMNTFNRFHSRLMYFCRGYYNFSIHVSVTKSWGYMQPNGRVDGVVGALLRKEVDIGMSPIFVKQERLPLVSYGRKTWNLRAAFILRNPKSRKSYQIFLKPLSTNVWIGIVLLCTASITAQLFIGDVVKSPLFRKNNVDMTWSYIILHTLGSLCQQGMGSCSNLLSGRIVVIFTLLFGSIVYQFYSASLVSFLLNVPTTLITNMQGILDQGFGVGCQDTLYDRLYLARSTNNVTKEIYNKTVFLQPKEGMQLVKNGHYAFHIGLEMAYPIIQNTFDEHTICELREVPMWGKRHIHAVYQKNSPFKDAMDVCLGRLSETGVLNREYIFWHPKKPHCIQSGSVVTINTGLNDFYPALAVLFIGMILSLHILIMEHVWYNKTHPIIKPYCE